MSTPPGWHDKLSAQLQRDEGVRYRCYVDSVGKLSIGVGRNLDDKGISHTEAIVLLENDIGEALREIRQSLAWAETALDDARFGALMALTFNMGIGSLLGFKKFLTALQAKDYEAAAAEMLDSEWAREVGARAYRLAEQVRTGEWQ